MVHLGTNVKSLLLQHYYNIHYYYYYFIEYPTDWVQRHLKMSGLEVINVNTFEKIYDYNTIKLQIDACRSTLRFIDDVEVRDAMSKKIDRIDEETKQICEECPDGKFTLGYDWVITATKR